MIEARGHRDDGSTLILAVGLTSEELSAIQTEPLIIKLSNGEAPKAIVVVEAADISDLMNQMGKLTQTIIRTATAQ